MEYNSYYQENFNYETPYIIMYLSVILLATKPILIFIFINISFVSNFNSFLSSLKLKRNVLIYQVNP